jgi:3-dehydroquinate dehydratase type I
MSTTRFAHDASIVMMGIRGTGRSTLALLAASSLGFRLVDTDLVFTKAVGMPRWKFLEKHGQAEHRRQELRVLHAVLKEHSVNTVIVCGLTSFLEPGQQLLLEYGKTHPVIYLMRSADEISGYLQNCDAETVSGIAALSSPTFRRLSNFEFYNLPDRAFILDDTERAGIYPPSLILKRVERDLLQLIASIRGRISPRMSQTQSPSSLSPLELRPHTYALSLPITRVSEVASRLRGIDTMSDAVELVIDLHDVLGDAESLSHDAATLISKAYYTLRRNVRLPVIYHVQMVTDNLSLSSSPWSVPSRRTLYTEVVRHGLRLGPEYITLDLHLEDDAKAVLDTKGYTKVMAHFFDQHPASEAWDSLTRKELVQKAERLGCELVRICQPATSRADNASLQRFTQYIQTSGRVTIPTIAYNTGVLGRLSCFMNKILTPVTHPLLRGADVQPGSTATWMPTVQEALEVLYASSTLSPMSFGIFGGNASTSLSPFLYNPAFAFCGMPHVYKVYQSTSLKDIVPLLEAPGFGGLSITTPFKSEVIPLLDELSLAAKAIGAVNTVIEMRPGKSNPSNDVKTAGNTCLLYGDNTDWIGIHTCIRRNLSPINAVRDRTVGLVLGAGGVAHAAVYSMIYLGIENIYVWNRTMANAEKLASWFHGRTYFTHTVGVESQEIARGGNNQYLGPSKVKIVSSMEEAWPAEAAPPNVIVSCIPRPDITLPDTWLSSKTGGVFIEVSLAPLVLDHICANR